jgi:SSS family solute:Na+ symporter
MTKRATEPGTIGGMLAGFIAILFVRFGTQIAWTWYVVIGATVTFAVGWLLSFALPGKPAAEAS